MPYVSKHIAIGLNTDDDPAVMPAGDYRWLKNGRVGKSQVENAGTVENILGMLALDDPMNINAKARGWVYHKELNEIYVLAWSSLGPEIYLIKDGVVSNLLSNPNLNIPELRLVWSITTTSDELLWATGEGEIMRLNIVELKAGGYGTVDQEEMVLIRRGPQYAPIATYKTGGSNTNLLGKLIYQFAYRYIYRDYQYSVLSPWSNQVWALDDDETGYIEVKIPEEIVNSSETIPGKMRYIEWIVKIDNLTEWQIIDRTELFLNFGKIIRYSGEALGITMDNNDAYKVTDDVPRDVVALEFMKNRLFIANYKTGYSATQGIGLLGHVVKANSVYEANATELNGFPYSSSYLLGLQFYDAYGRPGGVLRGEKFTTPRLIKYSHLPNVYWVDWFIVTSGIYPVVIPAWAHSYSIMRSDNQSMSFFLHGKYIDAYFMEEKEDGTRVWGKDYYAINKWDYLMLDITLFNENGIGYTHSKGDRVEFYLKGIYFNKPIEFVDGRFIAIKIFTPGANPYVLDDSVFDEMIIYTPKGKAQDTVMYETNPRYDILNPGESNRSFSVTSGILKDGDGYKITDRNFPGWDLTGYSQTDPYANKLIRGSHTQAQAMNPYDENYEVWAENKGRSSVLYEEPGEHHSTVTIKFSEEKIPDSNINNINKFNSLDRYDKIGEERTPIVKLTKARDVLIANHQRNATSLYINEGFIRTVDGGEFLAKSSGVITDDRELVGGYGCVPETIQEFEGRMWWIDPDQGSAVRYTVNGTQSISDKAYKVERFIKNISTKFSKNNEDILGTRIHRVPYAGYDPEFKEYFITFPFTYVSGGTTKSMVFSEETQRWIGEYELWANTLPTIYPRTNYKCYGIEDNVAYEFQNENSPGYNYFFGRKRNRVFTPVANPEPSAMKVWNNVWLTKINLVNGSVDPVIKITNKYGQLAHVFVNDFINEEGIWKAPIYFDRNTPNMTADQAHRNGNRMRSEWIQLEIESDLETLDPLVLTQVLWKLSEFTR